MRLRDRIILALHVVRGTVDLRTITEQHETIASAAATLIKDNVALRAANELLGRRLAHAEAELAKRIAKRPQGDKPS